MESWNREVNSGDRGSDCCPDRRSNNSTHTHTHTHIPSCLGHRFSDIWRISRGSTKIRIREKQSVSIRRYLVLTNQSPPVDDHLFVFTRTTSLFSVQFIIILIQLFRLLERGGFDFSRLERWVVPFERWSKDRSILDKRSRVHKNPSQRFLALRIAAFDPECLTGHQPLVAVWCGGY